MQPREALPAWRTPLWPLFSGSGAAGSVPGLRQALQSSLAASFPRSWPFVFTLGAEGRVMALRHEVGTCAAALDRLPIG